MSEQPLEPTIDAVIKPETAEELPKPEVEPEIEAATSSTEDPEARIPKTASQKLKDIDRKTFRFAGYIFWAMILISGGTAVAVILSRKNSNAKTNASQLQNPTEPPTMAPSLSGGKLPTCSHDHIMETLRLAFGDENCSRNTELRNTENCYAIVGENVANLSYEWLDLGDILVPFSLIASFGNGPNILFGLDLKFSRHGECNFDETDELFDRMQAATEAAKEAPCSHDEIVWKLKSVFGDENCSTVNSSSSHYDHVLQCKFFFKKYPRVMVDGQWVEGQLEGKEEAIIKYTWYYNNDDPFQTNAIPHSLVSFYYYPTIEGWYDQYYDEQEFWFSDDFGGDGDGPYEYCTFHEVDGFFDRVIQAKVKYFSA